VVAPRQNTLENSKAQISPEVYYCQQMTDVI